ncbi:MAG: IS110 family transposase [Chloroflexi bacterium]|jgi:transposase|nr:IS110 family transposase [Chloroflexota bacterium]
MLADVVVGLDVHLKTNSVYVLDAQGTVLRPPQRYPNTLPGTQQLIQDLAEVLSARDAQHLAVGAEATGWYWWHPFRLIAESPLLRPYTPTLYPFNPRIISAFRRTFSSPDKTDRLDAQLIADRLRLGRDLPSPFRYREVYARLRLWTRQRYHVVQDLVRAKVRAMATVYLKASALPILQPFGVALTATSREILATYSLQELEALPLKDLTDLLDNLGRHGFRDPEATARGVQEVAKTSYPLPEPLRLEVEGVLRQHLATVRHLERQIRDCEKEIRRILKDLPPHTLESIPGMGPVLAAGIISELGELAAFGYDEAKVAHYAGLHWPRAQSGDRVREDTPLTRRGNRYLRYYFCEAANSVRMHDAQYAAYYQRKYAEVPTHRHQRAVVLTARKLVRLVVALLRSGQVYEPRRT